MSRWNGLALPPWLRKVGFCGSIAETPGRHSELSARRIITFGLHRQTAQKTLRCQPQFPKHLGLSRPELQSLVMVLYVAINWGRCSNRFTVKYCRVLAIRLGKRASRLSSSSRFGFFWSILIRLTLLLS